MTNLPYAAPWQTGFARYSTQQAPVRAPASQPTAFSITVPDRQWWRVISLTAGFSLGGGATVRVISLNVVLPGNLSGFSSVSPLTATSTNSGIAAWMPNGSAYASSAVAGLQFGLAPLPDLLWQYGTKFDLAIESAAAGDSFNTNGAILYEVYTEDRPGLFVPVPATPVLV